MKEQKKKTARKWLGLLLAFVLVFTGSGMMILAQETAENSYAAVQNGLSEEPIDETEWNTELETADETEWSTELETADETELGTEGFYGTANLSLDSSEIMPFDVQSSNSVTVKVVWNDNNNQDGIRPQTITVQISVGSYKQPAQELNAENSWSCTFINVSQDENREIKIGPIDGYVVQNPYDGSANTYTCTLTHTPATKPINGSVEWNDNDNQDGKRPSSVTVRLHADGVSLEDQVKEVTADERWSYVFENLPVNANGSRINYTVTEDAVNEYATTIDNNNYMITNSYTPEKKAVFGSVEWNDNDNQDGKRPSSVTIRLLAEGVPVGGQIKEVTADESWSYVFQNLPVYKNGIRIAYTVIEDLVEGYTSTSEVNADDCTITYSHTPETTTINGTVTWLDADNQAGCRPQQIKVQLLANGVQTAEQTVTADMNWEFRFDGKPKYAAGTEISYTITTAAIERYATAIQQYNIINTCNRVKIQKIDQSSGNPLAGAVLQLCDSTGAAVAQWTSSEEAYEV